MGMRSFIAIRFSPEVDRELLRIKERLRQADKLRGIKWVESGNIHLTLQFLGEVEEKLLPQIASGLRKVLEDFPAFEAELTGLGAFPDMSRPRVIWAGIAQGARQLEELAARVQQANRSLGFMPEDRPFRAHVTLGRVKGRCDVRALSEAMRQAGKEIIGKCLMGVVEVVASRLSPQGPSYRTLDAVALRGYLAQNLIRPWEVK